MEAQWLLGMALMLIPNALVAGTALPGTVNYIEGHVTVSGKAMVASQDGSVTLKVGEILAVETGKAEVLLSPGTFLRVGNGGQIRMIAAELSNPRVEVLHSKAMVEVDYKPKAAQLDVMERGADTQLLKEGLYEFDADHGTVEVIDGKAAVAENGHSKDIGRGKELVVTSPELKPVSFNAKSEDDLYRWSDVRDGYLAQASEASARTVYVDGGWGYGWGPGWGLGWYWNPYFGTYSWLPYDGYFWSPFGYPFFSPGYVRYAPGIRAFGYRGAPGRVAGPALGAGRVGGLGAGRFSGAMAGGRIGGMGGGRIGGGRR